MFRRMNSKMTGKYFFLYDTYQEKLAARQIPSLQSPFGASRNLNVQTMQ